MNFTKRKFLSLPKDQQHKKCAELLRNIYKDGKLLTDYNEWQQWIGQPGIEKFNMKTISNRYHQHMQEAGMHVKEHNLLPKVRKGDKVDCECPVWPIAIYLENIRSAHNVGSILRTVEAFRLGKVLFTAKTPYIDNDQVKKTSMGAYEWVNCERQEEWNNLPKPIIALETGSEATPHTDFQFPETFTLVVGNEEYGCSDDTLMSADHLIEIPLRGKKNSLNVANAFAIAAAEIVRQRNIK